ncbi:hypothetical protein ARMSODRAFT_955535 [Armillaria solidipes]|uniref:Protein kinase domain-containing protein n=1 Tax=Armillaria solidipes TaxID=1076256 RepID=A0A2H3BXJ2_9AGAR|nr:hypothetical protein ARMSODRAFT_955535 [Armillaria solidipes]
MSKLQHTDSTRGLMRQRPPNRWSIPFIPRLILEFTPANSNTGQKLPVTIEKSFAPFTSAVVLLVQPLNGPFPSKMILKLNDRRCGNRGFDSSDLPWHPSVEPVLYKNLCEILRGARENGFKCLGGTEPRYGTVRTEGWEKEIEVWGEKTRAWRTEVRAYHLLQSLQGTVIPRFFGTVKLPLRAPPTMHAVTDFVPGMLLEYLDAPSLEDVEVGVDVTTTQAECISQNVLAAYRRIADLDCVEHWDIRLGNILLRPDHTPSIIDFGHSVLREEARHTGMWRVPGSGDMKEIRRRLLSRDGGALPWRVAETPYTQEIYNKHLIPGVLNDIAQELDPAERDARSERMSVKDEFDNYWRVKTGIKVRTQYDDGWSLEDTEDDENEVERTSVDAQ